MKNPIVLVAVLLSFALSASAADKKIYLITAADPTDAQQSDTFRHDAQVVQETFEQSSQQLGYEEFFNRNFFPPELCPNNRVVVYNTFVAGEWKGGKTVVPDGSGFGTAVFRTEDSGIDVLKNLMDAVKSCPAGTDDTIVVYWSGHGGYDNDEHLLSTSDKKNTLKRADLLTAMKAKNVRLLVLLTDTCANELGKLKASFTETEMVYDAGMATDSYRAIQKTVPPEPRIFPLFDELFFWHSGIVDINAAKKGEQAFSLILSKTITVRTVNGSRRGRVEQIEKKEENDRMGYFTAALFNDIQWADVKITADARSLAGKDKLDYLKYAQNLSLKEDSDNSRRRSGGSNISANGEAPLGVFPVNSIKRLTWSDLGERMIENTEILFNNAPREMEINQETQIPDIKLDIEQITAGLEDRLKQDDEWDAQRAQWLKENYNTLRTIRGINLERLQKAYRVAAVVLQILRMSGVNVPGLPIPGRVLDGPRIPGVPGVPRLPIRLPF